MREVRIDPAFVDDPVISDYVTTLGNRLLAAADPPRRPIEFFVVQDETINAFALIGGHIGLHTGLIVLTHNESELAGVVGHEIAHILQRHQSRLYQSQGKYQLASLAALALAILASRSSSSSSGQVTEAAMVGASAIMIQGQLDYTREHEREADRVGVTILDRAGYDPRGMVTFFERMQRANRLNEFKGAPSYLRTHPLTIERIADMQDRVESHAAAPGPGQLRVPPRAREDPRGHRLGGRGHHLLPHQLEDRTVLRPREEVYGLALALRRARDFAGAEKELATIRTGDGNHPAFEWLGAELQADQGRRDAAIETYRAALKTWPALSRARLRPRADPPRRGAQRRGHRLARREGPRLARRREALRAPVARLRGHGQRAGPAPRAGRGVLSPGQPRRGRGPARDRHEGARRRTSTSSRARRRACASCATSSRSNARPKRPSRSADARPRPTPRRGRRSSSPAPHGARRPTGATSSRVPTRATASRATRSPMAPVPPFARDVGPRLDAARLKGWDRARLRALLEDPQRANPDTVMPPYGRHRILDGREIERLIDYLHALP